MIYRYIFILFALAVIMPVASLRADSKLKIGVISGLSGAAAKWNRYQNMGIQLAQEELEKAGYPVEVVYEDSATKGPKVISAYNKLFDFDKVDAVIANDFGYVVAPLLPLVKKQKRFLVALSLPHERYCNEAPGYFFSATSQFSKTPAAFDKFFELNPRVKRIALFVFDDPEWGNSYMKIWKSNARSRGIEVVDTFLSADLTPDFKTPLAKALPKKPDAIFLAHEPESFLKAARQLGYKGHIVSANHIFEMMADSLLPRKELEGVYVVDPKILPEFRAKFLKRFGRKPILEAYAGYEGLRAVSKAFKFNPQKPQEGMRSVAYQGVAGQIDFTGDSCAGNLSRWGLFRFEGGDLRSY